MVELLKQRQISLPLYTIDTTACSELLPLVEIKGSVFIKYSFDRSTHIKLETFPDRSGYEVAVNRVHLPLDDRRESLLKCLAYASNLQRNLTAFAVGRRFLIILSAEGKHCSITFYQVRPNENPIADDLEGYKEEAILVLPVESDTGNQNPVA
jgi:hypothetical protein